MKNETKENKTLIDRLLDNAESVVAKAKRPLVRKRLKRAFEASKDSAEDAKLSAESDLADLRKNLVEKPENASDYISQIVKNKSIIINADKTIAALDDEVKELFN